MARVVVGESLVGKRVAKDIYTSDKTKLISTGTVLTTNLIARLQKYRVREIEILDAKDSFVSASGGISSQSSAPRRAVQHRRSKEELHAALKRIPLFATFTDEQIALTISCSTSKEYSAQTVLFRENEPGHSILIILQGSIKIYSRSSEGVEKILAVLGKGACVGELSILDGKPRSASAQTLETTELLVLSRNSFMGLLRTNFDICRSIMKELSRRLQDTTEHLQDLAYQTTHVRVIKNLIILANRFGQRTGPSIHVKLPLNYDELAQMAGVKRRDLVEVLRDLELRRILRMDSDAFELNLGNLRI